MQKLSQCICPGGATCFACFGQQPERQLVLEYNLFCKPANQKFEQTSKQKGFDPICLHLSPDVDTEFASSLPRPPLSMDPGGSGPVKPPPPEAQGGGERAPGCLEMRKYVI